MAKRRIISIENASLPYTSEVKIKPAGKNIGGMPWISWQD